MLNLISNPIGVLSLSKREILRFWTVGTQTLCPPLISSALFMYIFGVAIGSRLDFSGTGMTYLGFIIPGLMTMHLISSSYENTSSSLFIARWHNHIQEVLLSPLSYFEMVLGLLAGGVARALIVCTGVFCISHIFTVTHIEHFFFLIYFALMISVIFSCAGMMAALWAEDFSMLTMWNTYVIIPMVFLGGVFHPISLLPRILKIITVFNPMYYLVSGVRFSVTGVSDFPIIISVIVAFGMAVSFFGLAVYLFKIGYKLRT